MSVFAEIAKSSGRTTIGSEHKKHTKCRLAEMVGKFMADENEIRRPYWHDRDHTNTVALLNMMYLTPLCVSWDFGYRVEKNGFGYREKAEIIPGCMNCDSPSSGIKSIGFYEWWTKIFFHPAVFQVEKREITKFVGACCLCLTAYKSIANAKWSPREKTTDEMLKKMESGGMSPTAIIDEDSKTTMIFCLSLFIDTIERIETAQFHMAMRFNFLRVEDMRAMRIRMPGSCASIKNREGGYSESWSRLIYFEPANRYNIRDIESEFGYEWDELLDCGPHYHHLPIDTINLKSGKIVGIRH